MSITQVIASLPEYPSRSNPAEFNAKAEAWMSAERAMVGQINAWAAQANAVKSAINADKLSVEAAAAQIFEAMGIPGYETSVAKTDAAQTFTAAQTFDAPVIIKNEVREVPTVAGSNSAYTINIANGTLFDLTLTNNCALTFPAATAGRQFTLLLNQDATGGRDVTWPSTVRWAGGTAPTITAAAGKTDMFSFLADGTYWLGCVSGQSWTRA